jgi:hypothetical protein
MLTVMSKEVGEFFSFGDNVLKKNRCMEHKIQDKTRRSGCLLPHVNTHRC